MFWPKLSGEKIKQRIFDALSRNTNYRNETILGIPGTYLDDRIFYDDAPFLKDSPFLSSLIANPNHIGCHTLDSEHESMFSGTQEIEKDLIRICAEEMFKADSGGYDGYVTSGGTEANIEALWIYRNYYIQEKKARPSEIAIVSSEDTHYSISKAANLLALDHIILPVKKYSREIVLSSLENQIMHALKNGKKYFIVVLNLSTTMFGSIDDVKKICNYFNIIKLDYKLHIDAAYGGFIYPFSRPDNEIDFRNPNISSISIDGHKMLQAPYGTGIIMVRKNYLQYVCNENATYVKGKDYTLVGSRSGANAVCVWMILHAYGSVEWGIKIADLLSMTSDFCSALNELEIQYFHNPYMNIVAIRSDYISSDLAQRFVLVPDTHDGPPEWYKIVIMPHVTKTMLNDFLRDLATELNTRNV